MQAVRKAISVRKIHHLAKDVDYYEERSRKINYEKDEVHLQVVLNGGGKETFARVYQHL